ncbi:hypothetical protein PspLS_11014 [Pyricularia sp. CBS 133598]|nr:hypothetical protein PspLS_11014 [Pyricularia sp. CBS 133598]
MQFSVLRVFTVLALSTSVLGAPTSSHGSSIAQAEMGNAQAAATAESSAPGPHDPAEACVPCKEGEKAQCEAAGPKSPNAWKKLCYNCRYHTLDKCFYMVYDTRIPKDRDYWAWRTEKVKGKSWDHVANYNHPFYTTHGKTFMCCGTEGLSMFGGRELPERPAGEVRLNP